MVDVITQTIDKLGYVGIALLMLVETLIPPIPSELIMPLVGLAAANGELSLFGATLAAVAGATGGATAWYFAARACGAARLIAIADRHGRWLGLDGTMVDRPARWFARHGGWTVFLARILPGMRVYISIPAGLAGMGFGRFLLCTVAGYGVWYGLLGAAGYALGVNVDLVRDTLVAAAPWLWAAVAAAIGWRVRAARRAVRVPS